MRTWLEPTQIRVPPRMQEAVGGHPLVAEILARRGITDVPSVLAFLDPDRYTPASPTELPGLEAGAARLEDAIRREESICVWGDFDVDGQTATTLLVAALRDRGARVTYHIPIRASESHGVNLPVLERLIEQGIGLLLTCDTGIAAHDAVAYASRQGVEVIITDHHDLPERLPQALAVVNPKMLPGGHPLSTLPGVGVAYKLAEALYQEGGSTGEVERHLDLTALGIVADIAVQVGDTRYLLQRGLDALRRTRRLGLQAIMRLAGLDPAWLTEEHIGFLIGPRLNALGRLADANLAVELLTTQDPSRARVLATQLEGLNAQRKLLTDQVFQAAQAQIGRQPQLLDSAALVLSHPAWEAGVIGIVASRLVDHYQRPVVLIAAPPGELARGSARSVEGFDISAAIATQRELLHGYGGHPMAAGLTIYPERIPEFRRGLSMQAQAELGSGAKERTLQIDRYVPLHELTMELTADLERLAPFGPGNPAPHLATRGLSVIRSTTIGRDEDHLRLTVEDEGGNTRSVIWWNGAGRSLPQGRFDLAYFARTSTYQGLRDVQVEWVDARPVDVPTAELQRDEAEIEVVDHRQASNPLPLLRGLRSEADVLVWSEAEAKEQISGHDRSELTRAEVLLIWTTPPSQDVLIDVLERVSPKQVHLFAADPGMDQAKRFLERLAGLVKYSLHHHQGRLDVARLAAATAQRDATVRAGIARLAAGGQIVLRLEKGAEIEVGTGEGVASPEAPLAQARLESLLEETAAYRAYFRRCAARTLIHTQAHRGAAESERGARK